MAKRIRKGGHYTANEMSREAPQAHALLVFVGTYCTPIEPIQVAGLPEAEIYRELFAAKEAAKLAKAAPKYSGPSWLMDVYNNDCYTRDTLTERLANILSAKGK